MASEKVGVTYEVKDKATKNLKRVQKGFERTSKSVRETGEQSSRTATQTKSLSGAMGGLKKAALPIAGALAAGVAQAYAYVKAFKTVKKVVDASVEAFREQDEANRRLKVGLRTVYTNARDVDQAFQNLQPTIADLATSTMFGDEQLATMAGSFLTATEGAKATAKDLELIADIAEVTGQSAEKAAQQYARALNGELSPRIARMIGLTTDQVKALDSIEDATERAAAVQNTFSDRIGGASTKIDPYLRALKNVEDAQGDIQQAFGESITKNEQMVSALENTHEMLRRIETWVNNGGLDGLVKDLGRAAGGTVEMSEALLRMTGALETEKKALSDREAEYQKLDSYQTPIIGQIRAMWDVGARQAELYNDSVSAVRESTGEVSREIKDFNAVSAKQVDLQYKAAEAMRDYGQDSAEAQTAVEDLKKATDDLEESQRRLKTTTSEIREGLLANREEGEKARKEAAKEAPEPSSSADADKKKAQARREALQDAKDSLALAQAKTEKDRIEIEFEQQKAEIRKTAKSDAEAAARVEVAKIKRNEKLAELRERDAKARKDALKDARAEVDARKGNDVEAQLKKWAVEDKLSDLRLENARAVNGEERIRLDATRRFIELDQKALSATQRKNAEKMIELDTERKLLDLKTKQRNQTISTISGGISSAAGNTAGMLGSLSSEVGAGYEEKIQKLSEVEGEFAKRRIEQLKEQKELEQENLKLLQEKINAFGDLSDAGGQLGTALSDLASKQWDFSNATDATQAGLEAVSAAGGAAAGLLGDTVKEQAGIKAGFEAAAAAGAWGLALTTQNPAFYAAAVKHTTAAGMYGAVAGGAGSAGSGASGGGVSGGSSGGSQAPRMPDMNKAVAANKKAFLEALRESQNEQRSTTVINDFRGATLLERDPTSSRRARDVLNQSDRYRVGGQ